MRLKVLAATACVMALAACSKPAPDSASVPDSTPAPAAAPAQPASIGEGAPEVRAGLWEMSISADAVKGSSRICIDPAVQGVGAAYGQRSAKKDCSESQFTKTVDGLDFKSVCESNGTKVVSNGQVRGDLSSHYTVKVDVTTTRDGVTKTTKVATDATRVGDCPAGMAPGDQQMVVNGRTITIKIPPGA